MDAPKNTVRRAKALRKGLSPPEARLWVALRSRALAGYRFRRQHPVGPFVIDFYCVSENLAVEVDGLTHDYGAGPARDARRDAWLASHGIRTLRIPAVDVRDDLDAVVRTILAALNDPGFRI